MYENIRERSIQRYAQRFPDIMNIEEMCSALSISKKTGYKLLREGKIVGMKVGRTPRT
ncbi:MAG: excisionase family DNA-binding protein [[Ruminococcus] torques]